MAPGRSRKSSLRMDQTPTSVSQSKKKSGNLPIPPNEGLQSNLPNSEANVILPLDSEVQLESSTLNSISGNLSSPPNDTTSIAPNNTTSIASEDNKGDSTKKRGRGVARGFAVKNRMKEGNKIGGVIINEELNLPVGPAEKIFKMEIGILTRMLAPIKVFYWKDMTEEHKIPIMEKLQNEFDIDVKDQHTKMVLDHIMARRFTIYKHRCHCHYKKNFLS
ncbi:uncharacterized protein [Euphorbia lathyris]|uniref:uncharacterized protein n=1 Tax=Euphorbia lathyris TaxID=212925 RepID=UPI003313BB52